jgi:hypothetical protein
MTYLQYFAFVDGRPMDFAQLLREARQEAAIQRRGMKMPQNPDNKTQMNEAYQSKVAMLDNNAVDTAKFPLFTFGSRYANVSERTHKEARRSPMQDDLERYRVDTTMPSVYYIPSWITTDEEDAILHQVSAAPSQCWVQLKYRRLQVWGGSVTMTYEPATLPPWLQILCKALVDSSIFDSSCAPNHVLINGIIDFSCNFKNKLSFIRICSGGLYLAP